MVVSGEPGIGKTALLSVAAGQAGDFRVLRACGSPAETELSFAGLHELLGPVLDDLVGLDTPQGRALSTALGLVDGVTPDRFLVAAGVTTLLAQVAERRPVLCLVDDAHWLDHASLQSLLFAARRIRNDPIAMVFACRSGHDRLRELSQLPLLSLDTTAARTLLVEQAGRRLDVSVYDRVLTLANGNPLALVELGRQLAERGEVRDASGRLPLNERLRTSFLRRVDELSGRAQRLLLLLAAADAGDRGWLLRASDQQDLPTAALDEAERAQLVQVNGVSVQFAHPLVREAVYARATSAERSAAHRSLAASATDRERSVWHRALAATAPDEEVADQLVASATAAEARGARGARGTVLARAADLVDSHHRSTALRLEAAESFWEAGDVSRARAVLAVATSQPIDDPSLQVRTAHLRGVMKARSVDVLAGYEILIGSADLAMVVDPDLASTMLIEAVRAASYAGDLNRVAAAGRRAAALAARSNAPPLELDVASGIADVIDGRFDQGAGVLRRAVDAVRSQTDPSLARCAVGAAAAAYLGDEPAGRDLATRAAALARGQGLLAALPEILELQSVLEVRATPAAAEMHASEGLRIAEETGQSASAALHLITLATVAAWRGDQELVRARTRQVFDLAGTLGVQFWSDKATAALALLDLTLGRAGETVDRLEGLSGSGFHRGVPISTAADLVEAAIRIGQPARARPALRMLQEWASAVQTPIASALYARAQALAGDDSPPMAFERAVAYHALSGPSLEGARTELLYGEYLRRDRRPADARPHLRRAVEVFDRCRADPWAERARTELRASGEAPLRRTSGPAVDLTPQERQIAELAADGTPTKVIAGQLFLSPRTVDYHLRKVFTKLDITARAQLRGRLPQA